MPIIRGIKYITNYSPNKKLIAYISADPVYKEGVMDQIPENLKKKKKGNEPEEVKVPESYNFSLVVCPSLSSDSIDPDKFKVIKLPFVKPKIHMNEDQQPVTVKWCGNKALILQFWNQDLYLCSIDGECMKIEKNRGDKEKWSFLKE